MTFWLMVGATAVEVWAFIHAISLIKQVGHDQELSRLRVELDALRLHQAMITKFLEMVEGEASAQERESMLLVFVAADDYTNKRLQVSVPALADLVVEVLQHKTGRR